MSEKEQTEDDGAKEAESAVSQTYLMDEQLRETHALAEGILGEVEQVVLGKRPVLELVMVGVMAGGNILFEDNPGLAKTLLANTFARVLGCEFKRVQFTPDLLPADLTGTLVYDPRQSEFKTHKGPIFANIILADEINRSPAKVQSALLEAMQERTVTIGDTTYPLDAPFLVLATQNPIEQEGTYPLPEAQVDRFMLKLAVTYPDKDEELEIMRRMSTGPEPEVGAVVAPEEILRARTAVEMIYMDPQVETYIVDLVFATRQPKDYDLSDLADLIAFGASPRATISLAKAARAHAFLRRRGYVTPEDVRSIGLDVLRHRVLLTYEAEAEEMTSDDVVNRVLNSIEVP